MNVSKRGVLKRVGWIAAAATALGASIAAAQTTRTGLDSLKDDRLMDELAARGMELLLDRAFEVNGVKQEERDAIRSLMAIRVLTEGGALSGRQRDELLTRVVAGMERSLSSPSGSKDPKVLMQQAETLIRLAVFSDLNTLEYWGDSAETRGKLRPVAGLVSKILARTAELARSQADELANRLTNANDTAALERYQQLDRLAVMATYTRRMNDYAVIASMDAAEAAAKARLADETVEYLKQFDNAESEVQAAVRVQMGKIYGVRGMVEEALGLLDSVWSDTTTVVPLPAPGQRFEARYFAAATLLRTGKIAEAQARLDDLKKWYVTALGVDTRAISGAEGAIMMLQYRIHVAAKEDEKAKGVLVELLQKRPEFEVTILEQLASRVPAGADLKTLDVLSLRAVFRQGEIELRKKEGLPVDEAALDRAIAAGRQLLSDRTAVGRMAEETAIRLPLMLERRGRSLEAAVSLLDFLDRFGVGHRNAQAAMDEATFLVSRLRRERPDDVAVGSVYERLLAKAVAPPFSRRDLAYEWARRLQQTGKFAEAVRYFEQVPESDSRAALARFFRMVALKQMLDDGHLTGDSRRTRVADLLRLADQVAAEARDRLKSSSGDVRNDKLILVRTALVGADVALREQKNPQGTLKQLEGFETAAAGLSSEQQLTAQAMNLRVLALMDLGRNQDATKTLVALLEKTGGAEGADVVFRLLTRLNEEFDSARAAGDMNASRNIARSRAELSGFLVTWAEKNPDPKIKSYVFRYRIFDAETKRLAADLEPDPAERRRGLEAALKLYESLRVPTSTAGQSTDPVVELGISLIAYDLERWELARDGLALLLDQRRLGRAVIEEERNGETVTVPNDRYWEATYKLLRSSLKLVEQGKVAAETKQQLADGLKALYARWGREMGGPKWAPQFEAIRKEIAPDYQPPALDDIPATDGSR